MEKLKTNKTHRYYNYSNLWIVELCVKIIYPKFNFYLFAVFLAIKLRILMSRKHNNLKFLPKESFVIKTHAPYVHNFLLNDLKKCNDPPILWHKCLFVSKDTFTQLATENLFHIDHGILWIGMKLSADVRKKLKLKKNLEKYKKQDLKFLTSEVHKKLWIGDMKDSIDKLRIVPIVGVSDIEDNVILATEIEKENIISSFGFQSMGTIFSFHAIPSLSNTPQIAEVAEVTLVANDYEISDLFLKEILFNHFHFPRLLHLNDIFTIDINLDMANKQYYKYIDMVENIGRLHFKCVKLQNNNYSKIETSNVEQPYFIVKGVTQLSLGDPVHLIKPQDRYLHNLNMQENVYSCPTGLKKIMDDMQDGLSPFLNGDIYDLSSSLSSPIIPLFLLSGVVGSGRHLLVKLLAKYNGLNHLLVDCNALQSSTAKQTESKISATIQRAKAASPVIVLLDNFEVFGVDAENNEDSRVIEYFSNSLQDLYQHYTKHPIILIAVSESSDLKPNILRMFLDRYNVPKHKLEQRLNMLEWFSKAMDLNIVEDRSITTKSIDNESSKELLKRTAAQTETFVYGDLDTLMHLALRSSYLNGSEGENNALSREDLDSALESMRRLHSQFLNAPKIPKVLWADIGGLDKLKKELMKTIEFPIKYPHLFKNSNLKRAGLLMYGPPGCGKTLVAKAVCTELNVSFLSVKGPELLNMYIGQSEENVRKVFASALASSPCIIFLDELDALAPRRGAAGDSGGAADRVVSQLLSELDGVNHDSEASSFVFVMGATNRPDLLEQSLLRPGRLDKLVYVGPYQGIQEKVKVLTALCRSHKLHSEVSLERVAHVLPDWCTGADLLQVVSTARSAAVRALIHKLELGEVKESDLSTDAVIIGEKEMEEGIASFRPSVTVEELSYYESLKYQM